MNRTSPLIAVLASATLLAACGGGSDPVVETTTNTVPTDAQATAEAYTAFTATQPADEQAKEPLTLDGVMPPTSETAEPAPLQR